MKLDPKNWKEFYLKDLYKIEMGNKLDKNKMSDIDPIINFVSRISYNNGVDGKVDYIDNIAPFPKGAITVALGGSYLGSCFVQEEPFYTAQNVAVLKPKSKKLTHNINLFISGLIRYESKIKYYAFGRELNSHIDTDFSIFLPIQYKNGKEMIDEKSSFSKEGYVPDWRYMDKYVKSLHHKPITTKNKNNEYPLLEIEKWRDFRISSILTIIDGSGITKEEIEDNEGELNAVQSGEGNNGVLGKIDKDYCISQEYAISEKPCLTVARSGSAGFVSYQSDGCVVGDSAKILLLPDDVADEKVYLFIQTILTSIRFKYAYGRKVTREKYLNEVIKLPIVYQKNGKPYKDKTHRFSTKGYVPDWDFMKSYIGCLPYGDRLK